MVDVENAVRFGRALVIARQSLTQTDVAVRANLMQNEICRIEGGKPPSYRQLCKILHAFPMLISVIQQAADAYGSTDG